MVGDIDPIVKRVIDQFIARSELGKKKYGHTLHSNPLTLREWIEHAKQEHMDAILYLEKILEVLDEDNRISPTASIGELFTK